MIMGQLYKKVPSNLKGLTKLAYNLWWSWNLDAREMWKDLDPPLWYSSRHNPIKILRDISEERLEMMSENKYFLDHYQRVFAKFNQDMQEDEHLWWPNQFPHLHGKTIAYLSMEYGIHNSLPIYSGGLGILSGDHLKESSDLGVALTAVGFLYQEGYFIQKITQSGWQEAIYREMDLNDLPIVELMDPSTSKPLMIAVYFNDIIVYVKIWLVEVGRIKLYLMDSNINENPPWDRDLTDRLYGGNTELRLKQEMILGLGAVRLFDKLGITPTIWHLNEGHCSFSSIERIQNYMRKKKSFDEALDLVRKSTIFTTHTPVPAGHDVYPFNLIENYFINIMRELGRENFFSLGTYDFGLGRGAGFNMSVLGFRTTYHYNAVSRLHREVSEEMFKPLWDELKEKYHENFHPITYITNGVHIPSFSSETFRELFNIVDDQWIDKHDNPKVWEQMMDTLTDNDIWEYHKTAKQRLFRMVRETARTKLQTGEWDSQMALVSGALFDPNVLTIGFARRFATYKRATLILTDIERLKKILNNPYRPVQIIFSGKAHPADDPGKKLIQDIINCARNPALGHRIAFIENYDTFIAKILLQGVDIWLNNPLRPNEACGTSGMKAAINFVPNISILDGWWAEGYEKNNGWAINSDNIIESNADAQNWYEAKNLYDLLEKEVIPAYYDIEPPDNIPRKWIAFMRAALVNAMSKFSSRRMLKEYSQQLYAPLMNQN